ncbi:type II toxin-antitoxin system RelE/ParE family toxin [Silvibacterium acidisoli]|uniref:type II toxin-antitoxin system RelE/ParE family toxin n=1 Tax=Acidobacteriaceae bacterium ZG23-2 TaxID=2883246 RepID=UPI00406C9E18
MQVHWTSPAFRDFAKICDYTDAHFGLFRGRQTAEQISIALDSLEKMPLLGRPGRKQGTRELVLPDLPFLAIYRVRNDRVDLLRILHGAQRWP